MILRLKDGLSRLRPWRLPITLGLSLIVLLIGTCLWILQSAVEDSLQPVESAILRTVATYHNILKNAAWPTLRYIYLQRQNEILEKDDLDKIEEHMLQASFGFNYDYFALRNLGGETIIEVRSGALVDNKSPIHIIGEENFSSKIIGTATKVCNINKEAFLCLIDFPRKMDNIADRLHVYTVIGIPVRELLYNVKYPTNPILPLPAQLLSMSLLAENSNFRIFGPQGKLVFKRQRRITDQFYISAGIAPWTMLWFIISVIVAVALFGGIIYIITTSYFRHKLKTRVNSALIQSRLENFEKMQRIVRSVTHDIRSPLATLQTCIEQIVDAETKTLVNHVIRRMRMIIHDLSMRSEKSDGSDAVSLPVHLIFKLLSIEKNKEYGGATTITLPVNLTPCWVTGSFSGLLRVLSNLINNAMEATLEKQPVMLDCQPLNTTQVLITIRDQGRGIPADILSTILEEGVSIGKEKGSGLGLFQAKQIISQMGGSIQLNSKPGSGTTVSLVLPSTSKPSWDYSQIHLHEIQSVVVVDDEISVFQLWKEKFRQQANITLLHFSHPRLIPWSQIDTDHTLFLIDNTYGNEYGLGLEFIEQHRNLNRVLVTKDWHIKEIQETCTRLNVPLCGKDFITLLPISAK